MLRNGLGSLRIVEAATVIAILFIGPVLMFRLAVSLFQYGSISYTSEVSIRTALQAGKKPPTRIHHRPLTDTSQHKARALRRFLRSRRTGRTQWLGLLRRPAIDDVSGLGDLYGTGPRPRRSRIRYSSDISRKRARNPGSCNASGLPERDHTIRPSCYISLRSPVASIDALLCRVSLTSVLKTSRAGLVSA